MERRGQATTNGPGTGDDLNAAGLRPAACATPAAMAACSRPSTAAASASAAPCSRWWTAAVGSLGSAPDEAGFFHGGSRKCPFWCKVCWFKVQHGARQAGASALPSVAQELRLRLCCNARCSACCTECQHAASARRGPKGGF
jgi:hypothetical protein